MTDDANAVAPFSDDTEVTVDWETRGRCHVQVDGLDLAILEFFDSGVEVKVQVWDRLAGSNPGVAAAVMVPFYLDDDVPTPEATTTTTIPMGPTSAAYYKGVAAGIKVDEAMSATWAGQPIEQRRYIFWFLVGRNATDINEQSALEAFVIGASVRQPRESSANDDESGEPDDAKT